MKRTALHLILAITVLLQFGALVAWYIGMCLWAGGEAWLAALFVGIPGVLVTIQWFKRMCSMRPIAWVAAFFWFLVTVAVALTRAKEDFLSHPIALIYATTALVAWLMMWHRTVMQTIRQPLRENTSTQQAN